MSSLRDAFGRCGLEKAWRICFAVETDGRLFKIREEIRGG